MFRIATSLLILALMISVAGPVTAAEKSRGVPRAATHDRGLGLVVQNNIAAMVVDLNPSYANTRIEGGDGQLADAALTRYRSGKVKPLVSLSGSGNLGQAGSGGAATAGGNTQTGPR